MAKGLPFACHDATQTRAKAAVRAGRLEPPLSLRLTDSEGICEEQRRGVAVVEGLVDADVGVWDRLPISDPPHPRRSPFSVFRIARPRLRRYG